MSNFEFDSDEEVASGALPLDDPSEENLSPSRSESEPPEDPDEFIIGGQAYPREAVEDKMERWDKMEAAHTRRSQEVAEARREMARREAILQEREERLERGAAGYGEEETDVASEILKRLSRMEQRFETGDRASQERQEMEAAVASQLGRPLADRDELMEFMGRNELRPDQAPFAYSALYGQRVGETVGEQRARHRLELPVMGSNGPHGVSPGFTGHGEVPQRERPDVGNLSWEELERHATEDPRI